MPISIFAEGELPIFFYRGTEDGKSGLHNIIEMIPSGRVLKVQSPWHRYIFNRTPENSICYLGSGSSSVPVGRKTIHILGEQ